ncbi:MAG: hypothetical protein AAF928_13630 [Myxococcota bacterium]
MVLAAVGCGDAEEDLVPTQSIVALDADLSADGRFYDAPYPSDLRLDDDGRPRFEGFINNAASAAGDDIVSNLLQIAGDRPGWPTVTAGYVRFDAPLAPLAVTDVIPASTESPLMLVDVDPDSPERGRLFPMMAETPDADPYVPSGLLAMSMVPGFILHPNRTYAYVVTDTIRDAAGNPVTAAPTFAALREGDGDPAAVALHAPLWDTLDGLGVDRTRVVAASVFTTGDIVQDTFALTERVRERYDVTIDGLRVDPDDGDHERFCELLGTVTFPEFQVGTPPYNTEGNFTFDADGFPVEQRTVEVPVVITLPKGEMPAEGYPLVMYFHGSGGIAAQVVDRGFQPPGGVRTKGEGPAFVLARHGFATVGSAHPVNPERLGDPDASDIAYLNLGNVSAFRDTFRQGIIEQRLYLDALLDLELDPSLLDECTGMSLPAGASHYRIDPQPVMAMGQSMGGMYTNLVGAVDPRIEAVVPTGAGGLWSYFILETTLVGGRTLLPIILRSEAELSSIHPALNLLETAWEAAEPAVYMPRLARRPLDGHPARPIYEPVGQGDSFFPVQLYDRIALAYGHPQVGDQVWPEMQTMLALDGLDGFLDYPVENNLTSATGAPFTGVVVQYAGDGFSDPHVIFAQLDEVKHQYGCFFETFFTTGTATVAAPAPLGTPCRP